MLSALLQEITGKAPQMWGSSIIGFGQYHYVYASGREGDALAIGFSPRKAALTLYLSYGIERHKKLLERLGPHTLGKACLYIKCLGDIDMGILKELLIAAYAEVVQNQTVIPQASIDL